MKDNNERFLEAYNRLDSFLQSLVKISGHVTMISYLERILPEKKRSELKTIRQHRNNVEHSVPPGSKKPVVPEAWITFLSKELDWCKRNAKSIAPKLRKIQHFLKLRSYRFRISFTPIKLLRKKCDPRFRHNGLF